VYARVRTRASGRVRVTKQMTRLPRAMHPCYFQRSPRVIFRQGAHKNVRDRTHERKKNERSKGGIALLLSGYCAPAEDDVPDFHELGVDIERQFHELDGLDDAIFIDGWFLGAALSSLDDGAGRSRRASRADDRWDDSIQQSHVISFCLSLLSYRFIFIRATREISSCIRVMNNDLKENDCFNNR